MYGGMISSSALQWYVAQMAGCMFPSKKPLIYLGARYHHLGHMERIRRTGLRKASILHTSPGVGQCHQAQHSISVVVHVLYCHRQDFCCVIDRENRWPKPLAEVAPSIHLN